MAKNVSFYHFQNMNDDVLGILAQLHALTFPQFAPRGRGPSSDTLFAFELWTHSSFSLGMFIHSRWEDGEERERVEIRRFPLLDTSVVILFHQ